MVHSYCQSFICYVHIILLYKYTHRTSLLLFILGGTKSKVKPAELESGLAKAPQVVRTSKGKHKDFGNLSGESMRFVCWNIYQVS